MSFAGRDVRARAVSVHQKLGAVDVTQAYVPSIHPLS